MENNIEYKKLIQDLNQIKELLDNMPDEVKNALNICLLNYKKEYESDPIEAVENSIDTVKKAIVEEKLYYKLLAAPYASQEEYDKALNSLRSGFNIDKREARPPIGCESSIESQDNDIRHTK